MASGPNIDSKFQDSHITGKHPSSEDGAMMSPWRGAESKPMQRTRVSVGSGSSKMRPIVIIIELSYRYRYNFDLSYRLSIENSIGHIVTALRCAIDGSSRPVY